LIKNQNHFKLSATKVSSLKTKQIRTLVKWFVKNGLKNFVRDLQVTACNLNRGIFGKMKFCFHEEIIS